MGEVELPEHIRQVIPDFMRRCQMIQNLGKGTFGYVSLYDTPKGRCAIKETKNDSYRVGFPKNFIYETDALYKFSCLPNVCRLKGIMYEDRNRKGYLLLEQMDGDLSKLAEQLTFQQRITLLPGLISDIGTTLALINSLGFIHNDMKCNNILHKTTRQGTVFKLSDFGNFSLITNPHVKYKGITVYSSPYHSNVFSQELWAFCVCCTELLLGGKTFSSRERDAIIAKYTTEDGFDIYRYLNKRLGNLVKLVPEVYWNLVKFGFSKKDYTTVEALTGAGFELPLDLREKILEVIPRSREDNIHPKHKETTEEFVQKIVSAYSGRNRHGKLRSFRLLTNYFFGLYGDRLSVEEGKQYLEMIYVSLLGNRTDNLVYFRTAEEFVRIQKAFFVTMKHQVLLLPEEDKVE